MIQSFQGKIADANDLHGDSHLLDGWLIPTKTIWHRKAWEYLYILQQFRDYEFSIPTRLWNIDCIGFGCGNELIPYMLASDVATRKVVVTDAPINKRCWVDSNQYLPDLHTLRANAPVQLGELDKSKLEYRFQDMNDLHLQGSYFNFIWSASSLEHLGSIDAAIEFLISSSERLQWGGVAVHCTEYNVSSNTKTKLTGDSIYFREQDLERLRDRLSERGFELSPIDLHDRIHPFNSYIDRPPYNEHPSHMKLLFDGYVITSVGFCIRRMHG